jgi:hypothetical protein
MGSKKKNRDKAYRKKPVAIPLGLHDRQKMEFPGYSASLALGQSHLEEQHIYDILSNADMVRRLAPDGHELLPLAQSMVECIAAIQKRAQEVGKLGVTGDQMKLLREGVGRTMDYLRTLPHIKIVRAAHEATAEFDRLGALRV